MVFNKFLKLFVFVITFLSLLTFVNSAFPQFNFDTDKYDGGSINVVGQVSSGTQVQLKVNGIQVGSKDIFADSKTIILDSDIIDEQIPVGSSIVFRNNNPSRVYRLNFSDGTFRALLFGETVSFKPYEVGQFKYQDLQAGVEKKISAVDTLVNFSFDDVQAYFEDGENLLQFTVKHPINTKLNSNSFNFTVDYNKYSNNINLRNITNVTTSREVYVDGFISQVGDDVYYLLNREGDISNSGLLVPVQKVGNFFSVTVDNLREGDNSLRIITTQPSNPNIFTGEKKVNILSDTIRPYIDIESGLKLFTNDNNLVLNISTDAVLLNYTFKGRNFSEKVEGQSIILDLSLGKGENSLVLTAIDIAGNIYKESHNIYYDRDKPQIVPKSLKPETMFENGIAHFQFQKIEGKTNKPEVSMVIFTTVDRKNRCEEFTPLFYRDLGHLDGDDAKKGPNVDLNETQLTLISALVHRKITLTTDSEGNFDAIIALEDANFERSDINNNNQINTPRIQSDNRICFIMSDKFGNINTEEEVVKLDLGNTLWRPGEITTIPNTVYAAEIEQKGDARAGDGGNIEVGIMARIQYIGDGEVTEIRPVVSVDSRGAKDASQVSIPSGKMNYKLDKTTNELVMYFPVKIKALNKLPIDYPDKFDLAFQVSMNYKLKQNNNIPLDTTNPIYFQTSLNVEKPLDHTRWLTPSTIAGLQNFLNRTINFTQQLTTFMQYAAIGGTLACTGARFVHSYQVADAEALFKVAKVANPDKNSEGYKNAETVYKASIAEADRLLYRICDRVACTAAPYKCDYTSNNQDDNGYTKIDPTKIKITDKITSDKIDRTKILDTLDLKSSDGKTVASIEDFQLRGTCITDDGKPGVRLDANLFQYEEDVDNIGGATRVKDKFVIRNDCTPAVFSTDACNKATKADQITGCTLQSVNFNSAANICYNPATPKYDDTRCWLPGYAEGYAGKDPGTSIISSVQCGCITNTYSYLQMYLRIMTSINECLEQAKFGTVKGSYCERLISQSVCDIATNVVLPELQQNFDPRNSPGKGGDTHDQNSFLSFLGHMRATDKQLGERYKGNNFFNQLGLGTNQLINKACVGAITGDWSVLTDSILTAVEKNQVRPIFGSPLPESRMQGFDPITGDLSIRYFFTHAVMSGGQRVEIKVDFICDPNAPGGEYCPSDGPIYASEVANSDIRTVRLSVPEGGSSQESVVIMDHKARFWYNRLKLTHSYQLNGKVQTETEEFSIIHKQEQLLANCYFSGGTMASGASWKCDSIFTQDGLDRVVKIDETSTKFIPKSIYYPGESPILDLVFTLSSSDTSKSNLVARYLAVCKSKDGNEYYLSNDGSTEPQSISLGQNGVPKIGDHTFLKFFDKGLPDPNPTTDVQQTLVTRTSVLTNDAEYSGIKFVHANKDTKPTGITINRIDFVSASENVNTPVKSEPATINPSIASGSIQNELTYQFTSPIKINSSEKNLLQLQFNANDYKNLGIYLIRKSDGGLVPFSTVNLKNNLAEGPCTLKLRLFENGQDSGLTKENFETYEVNGNQILSNVDTKGLIKKEFRISRAPSETSDYITAIDFINPVNGRSICLNLDSSGKLIPDQKINLQYIYQQSPGLPTAADVKLNYALDFGEYGVIASEPAKVITEGNKFVTISVPLNGVYGKPALVKRLENLGNDGISSFVTSGTSRIDGVLRFNLDYKKKEGEENSERKTDVPKTISIGLTASNNCDATLQSNSGAEEIQTQNNKKK